MSSPTVSGRYDTVVHCVIAIQMTAIQKNGSGQLISSKRHYEQMGIIKLLGLSGDDNFCEYDEPCLKEGSILAEPAYSTVCEIEEYFYKANAFWNEHQDADAAFKVMEVALKTYRYCPHSFKYLYCDKRYYDIVDDNTKPETIHIELLKYIGDFYYMARRFDEAASFYRESATIITTDKSFYKDLIEGIPRLPSLQGLSNRINECEGSVQLSSAAIERSSQLLLSDGRYSAKQRENSRKKTYIETRPPEEELRRSLASQRDYF